MKFEALTPILWTHCLNESIEFYTKILDFTIKNKQENYAFLIKDKTELMLSKPPQETPIGFSGSLYFTVNDIETLWFNLKNKTPIYYKLETFSWDMKEFAITDPNGYIIQFGQSI